MSEELKRIIKIRTKGKEEPVCVFVKIREAKDIVDVRIKTEDGITTLRVHSTNEHLPKWYLHGYLIDLKNLRLNYKDVKKSSQVQEVLLNPSKVVHPATKKLLVSFERDFGGVIPDGKKLFWKTQKFKKYKDPFKMKMKTLN
ncbi:MAG: hypothetical protein ACTSVU_07860 [Promethearchaeota archaeon]